MTSAFQTRPNHKSLPLEVTATYLPQLFGEEMDFSACVGAHPLIAEYLFSASESDEAVHLLEEIRWILKGLGKVTAIQLEDFLTALRGLKITILHYDIKTWSEAKSILDAEKNAFRRTLPK